MGRSVSVRGKVLQGFLGYFPEYEYLDIVLLQRHRIRCISVSRFHPHAWCTVSLRHRRDTGPRATKVILQRGRICTLCCSFQEGFMTKIEPGRKNKGLTAEWIPNPSK